MDFLLKQVNAEKMDDMIRVYLKDKSIGNEQVIEDVMDLTNKLATNEITEIEYVYKMSIYFRMMTQVLSMINRPKYLH